MELHELRPIHKQKKPKRIGRGGKRGTYSGRGIKGQRSRAGRKFMPLIRNWIKRYPKLRGYRSKKLQSVSRPSVVNLEILEKKFKPEDTVSPDILIAKKIIRRIKGKVPEVKILGKGKLTKKLIIKDCQLSKTAEEKIKKVGGTVELKTQRV